MELHTQNVHQVPLRGTQHPIWTEAIYLDQISTKTLQIQSNKYEYPNYFKAPILDNSVIITV